MRAYAEVWGLWFADYGRELAGFYALLGGSGLLRLRLRSLGPRVTVHIYLSASRSIYVLMYIHQKAYIHTYIPTYIHTYILYGNTETCCFNHSHYHGRYFKVDLVRGFRSSDPQNILEPFQRKPAAQQPYKKRNYTLTVNPSPSAESDSLQPHPGRCSSSELHPSAWLSWV